jgi:hypothetical protein
MQMAYLHRATSWGLVVAFVVLDWLPVLGLSSTRRLRKQDRDVASAFLSQLVTSRFQLLRTMVIGVRGAILSAYFDQEEVQAAIGYEPARFLDERIALRNRLLAAGAGTEGGRP